MPKAIDLTGYVKGRLTVVGLAGSVDGRRHWLCECTCGVKKTISGANFKFGGVHSCGCLKKEMLRAEKTKHGCGSRKNGNKETRLYRIWMSMKNRCRNPNNRSYRLYGGRGVEVCKAWLSFVEFNTWALGAGYADNLEIDRIDNYKGYDPDNCRWVTHKENCNNRRYKAGMKEV